ncbi:unnamed protein product [Penicillium glandicola]
MAVRTITASPEPELPELVTTIGHALVVKVLFELIPEIVFELEVQNPLIMTPVHVTFTKISRLLYALERLDHLSFAYEPAFRSLSETSVASRTDPGDLPTTFSHHNRHPRDCLDPGDWLKGSQIWGDESNT